MDRLKRNIRPMAKDLKRVKKFYLKKKRKQQSSNGRRSSVYRELTAAILRIHFKLWTLLPVTWIINQVRKKFLKKIFFNFSFQEKNIFFWIILKNSMKITHRLWRRDFHSSKILSILRFFVHSEQIYNVDLAKTIFVSWKKRF